VGFRGFEALGLIEGGLPVFGDQMRHRQQSARFGIWLEPIANRCVLQGVLGIAGTDRLQASPPILCVENEGRSEQAEIGLAPAASIGRGLESATGRATQFRA